MSFWANIKFFPEPTGELYGWLLPTFVKIKCRVYHLIAFFGAEKAHFEKELKIAGVPIYK